MKKRNELGITLITLVVTIIVLLILAGVTLVLTIGDNGIITKAEETKKTYIISEIKEKIILEILDKESESYTKGEKLKQEELESIIAKYGELQEDGDTIKLKEVNAEISLKDIYKTQLQVSDNKEHKSPIKLSTGFFIMGSDRSINTTDIDILTLNDLEGYNKCKITLVGNIGTYISAKIYIDGNLVETISDTSEHEIALNNNSKMVINLYSYNGLICGSAGIENLEIE